MLKIDRQKVTKNKMPLAFLFIEIIAAFLVVYVFYKLLGFNLDLRTGVLSMEQAFDPVMLFSFVLLVGLLAAIYFTIKRRFPELFAAQEKAKATIKDKAKEKLFVPKKEPRAAALLLIQFMFIMVVAATIVAWADPEMELVPWSKCVGCGIEPPLTTILNTIVAAIVLLAFYYLYSFTAWYRKKG